MQQESKEASYSQEITWLKKIIKKLIENMKVKLAKKKNKQIDTSKKQRHTSGSSRGLSQGCTTVFWFASDQSSCRPQYNLKGL